MAEKKDDKVAWVRLILGVVFVGFIIAIVPYSIGDDWIERGQIGDMFGVVNTFFSGLAFVGLLVAIFLQRKELSLQREELRLTRKEVRRSAAAQEKSEEALRKQAASLKATAEINALTALLETTTTELSKRGENAGPVLSEEHLALIENRKGYIEHLKGILDGKAN